MIVPFPAGGPSDTLARILIEPMRESLGQPVIVENVSGAGGGAGTGRAARAAPDGYTLSLGHWETHVLNAASYKLQYDVLKDFEPIALVANTPQWIIARETFPANNLQEFIAWLKANPSKGSAGAVGPAGAGVVAGVYFQQNTGTSFQFVPYRGGAPLNQDLLAGQIDFSFGQAASSLALVRSSKLKAYAVLSKGRWDAAPDVPTTDEAGIPGLYSSFWHALWAPKGTPREVVVKLNAAVVHALANPAVRQRLTDVGQQIWPREQQTPEALAAHHKAEAEKWWPIVKAANIKASD
jgi:tripartite-type tricarboxylate transporter receptor subunit TctC